MQIGDDEAEAAFRASARAHIDRNYDALVRGTSWPETPKAVEAHRRNQRILYEGGLVGVAWPVEHGGRGGSPMDQVIVEQEMALARLPRLINLVAIGMVGPAIMAHGSIEQRSRYLRPMLDASEIWCQLFSEPGAGSDVAAVSTRAVPVEGGWLVNGQKVWTSGAQYADWGLLVARTGAPRHAGLTTFVIDMRTPGIDIRPLRQMTGDSKFSEVFFDDVFVPAAQLLGDVDQGWAVVITTLMSERMTIGGAGTEHGATIEDLLGLARRKVPELPPFARALARQDLARCWIDATANRATGYRRMTVLARGEVPGAEASVGKITSTTGARSMADLGVRLHGQTSLLGAANDDLAEWQHASLFTTALTIAGGTTEVLKNVVGERVLGLPADPKPSQPAKG